MPRISVIIPAYNEARSIASVLAGHSRRTGFGSDRRGQ